METTFYKDIEELKKIDEEFEAYSYKLNGLNAVLQTCEKRVYAIRKMIAEHTAEFHNGDHLSNGKRTWMVTAMTPDRRNEPEYYGRRVLKNGRLSDIEARLPYSLTKAATA